MAKYTNDSDFVTSDSVSTETKSKNVHEGSSFPFEDDHSKEWGLLGTAEENTPMGRAWARAFRRGVRLGPPIAPAYEFKGREYRFFQYGYGERELTENVNLTVIFYDGRGVLCTESGL